MNKTLNKTIPELEAKSTDQVAEIARIERELNSLMHDINEYGEVLRDQSIDLLIAFIQRNTKMRQTIANL